MHEPGTADRPETADEPVLPERSSDDSDRGWGERDVELAGSHGGDGSDGSDDDDERLIREKPPHW